MDNEVPTYRVNWDVCLLALLIWREARGEDYATKVAVAWSVRNRVLDPGKDWWGDTWVAVMTKPWQYTSLTAPGDPNLVKFPAGDDGSWLDSIKAAEAVYAGACPDPVGGATHYFDRSLDANPPVWAEAEDSVHVCDVGAMRFWKAR